jgi:hypothetical protein
MFYLAKNKLLRNQKTKVILFQVLEMFKLSSYNTEGQPEWFLSCMLPVSWELFTGWDVVFFFGTGKGKVVLLCSKDDAWGERRYSTSFLTSALEGGEWSASCFVCASPPVPIVQDSGWAPEPLWMQRLEEKFPASIGDCTSVIQSVVTHYTD